MSDTETSKAKSRKTVTVACKLPHGLVLRLYKMEPHDEPVMGGGTKTVQRAVPIDAAPVTLAGYAAPFGQSAKAEVLGGFALTANVDGEFFAEWMKQNASSDVVKNGLVKAHESSERARDYATEHASLRSGLEPMSQDKDPRNPRIGGLTVETAKEQPKVAA